MRKISGTLCILLGAALIMSALFLFGHNRDEDMQAGKAAGQTVQDIRQHIGDRQEPGQQDTDVPRKEEMPVVEIDGYGYVGYLSISAIHIELPVMAEWDYARLKIAPCRQFGSSVTDDLVIAAHNYDSHFGKLKELSVGDEVVFTDMEGGVNTYTVEKTDILDPASVEAVEQSGFALVLYTCTYGGKSRVTVFCNRTADGQ